MVSVITEECALAVSADRMWKVSCSGDALLKASAGCAVVKSRVLARDDAALVPRNEVLEGSKLSRQLKSQVTEVKLEAAGDGTCVAKFRVEYEGALAPEEQAELVGGYLALMKIYESYLVANPAEYA